MGPVPRALAYTVGLLITLASGFRALGAPHDTTAGGPVLSYRLAIPEPGHRELQVELRVSDLDGPLDLRMSRTSPGRYALHEFAKNVFDIMATDDEGRALTVDHVEPSRWLIRGHSGTVRVHYRVFGDRVDGTYLGVGPLHAHVNPPATFAWPAGLDRPITIAIDVPPGSGWTVATQLPPGDAPNTWRAPTLAFLMDSPLEISRHFVRRFHATLPEGSAGPAPEIDVVLHHLGGPEPMDALVAGLQRVVREEAEIFGEYPPFEGGRYTFLFDFLPWATADGMEHRNSTVVTGTADGAMLQHQALETGAHEFFHAWNVERIRPRSLEPFDLQHASVSGELWLAEGVTSYYEDVVLARAGLITFDQAIRGFQVAIDALMNSQAPTFRSAAEMSRMASLFDGANPVDRTNWSSTYLSYYTHGQALGIGFDLAIREKTGNRKSLDDFMRVMWQVHGRPGGARPGDVDRPYTLDDVRSRLGEVTGDRAFADGTVLRFVEGHERMDYAGLLATAGLVLRRRHPGQPSLGQTALQPTGDALRLASQPPVGSPLYLAGLGEDDEVTGINGKAVVGFDTLDRAFAHLAPGAVVSLRFSRRGEQREQTARVTLVEDAALEIVPIERTGRPLTDAARRLRAAWLGPVDRKK
jgi:predicted metalloprotease with PDZ domain